MIRRISTKRLLEEAKKRTKKRINESSLVGDSLGDFDIVSCEVFGEINFPVESWLIGGYPGIYVNQLVEDHRKVWKSFPEAMTVHEFEDLYGVFWDQQKNELSESVKILYRETNYHHDLSHKRFTAWYLPSDPRDELDHGFVVYFISHKYITEDSWGEPIVVVEVVDDIMAAKDESLDFWLDVSSIYFEAQIEFSDGSKLICNGGSQSPTSYNWQVNYELIESSTGEAYRFASQDQREIDNFITTAMELPLSLR